MAAGKHLGTRLAMQKTLEGLLVGTRLAMQKILEGLLGLGVCSGNGRHVSETILESFLRKGLHQLLPH